MVQWGRAIQQMYDQCKEVGPKYCMQVKYEDLVLHPRPTLKKILKFADLEWTENVMEHQKHMGDISLSSVEKSTDQVSSEFIGFYVQFIVTFLTNLFFRS